MLFLNDMKETCIDDTGAIRNLFIGAAKSSDIFETTENSATEHNSENTKFRPSLLNFVTCLVSKLKLALIWSDVRSIEKKLVHTKLRNSLHLFRATSLFGNVIAVFLCVDQIQEIAKEKVVGLNL